MIDLEDTMDNWRYYNHALIPTTPPHVEVDTSMIKDGSIWKSNSSSSKTRITNKPLSYKQIFNGGGYNALLARWTSDFDCGYETNWWYVIKDTPFDIESLKAKRRYEINKGLKNFLVKIIDPKDYLEELYEIQVRAFEAYPQKYRPMVNHDEFISNLKSSKNVFHGAFSKDDQKLCGYTQSSCRDKCIDFSVLKTIPQYEKLGVNAALVYGLLEYYKQDISSGKYICDGSRSINHETHFQDYLEKYFGFRKAYCRLQIVYRSWFGRLIKTLYRFRKLLKRFDDIRIVHFANAILTMEEIRRKCDEEK